MHKSSQLLVAKIMATEFFFFQTVYLLYLGSLISFLLHELLRVQ